MIDHDGVLAALGTVTDPELDRPLTDLGFVQAVHLNGGDILVELRLPTYWCAANFAYVMATDARDAIERLPGVGRVQVELVDHFESARITAGVCDGQSFEEVFPDEATDGLDGVRRTFRRKAFLGRQAPVLASARRVLSDGDVVALTLGDGSPPAGVDPVEWEEYLTRRRDMGLPQDAGALAFTMPVGTPLVADTLDAYLRLARSVRISAAANAELCTGLLAARYHEGIEEWQRREVLA
jgi:metal-sulfur cluster biosynthetic enzyme